MHTYHHKSRLEINAQIATRSVKLREILQCGDFKPEAKWDQKDVDHSKAPEVPSLGYQGDTLEHSLVLQDQLECAFVQM